MIVTSETASIAKFIIENAVEGTVPYYEEMRENFAVPSVFFPSPVVSSSEHTVSSYSFIYSWSVVVFATNDDLAYENAIRIAKAIRDNAMLIPVVDSDGQPTDDYIRITKCEINANDSCAKSIDIGWRSTEFYRDVREVKPTADDVMCSISRKENT